MTGAGEFDTQFDRLEAALAKVQQSQGGKVKLPGAELNFLVVLEKVRDMMHACLSDNSDHERDNLTRVFGGDCARFARLRAILSAAELSEMNANDQRLRMCLDASNTVERVLNAKGFEYRLREAGEAAARAPPVAVEVVSGRLSAEAPALIPEVPAFAAEVPAAVAEVPALAPELPAAVAEVPASVPAPAAEMPTLSRFIAPVRRSAVVPTLTPPPPKDCVIKRPGEDVAATDNVKREVRIDIGCEATPEVEFGPEGGLVVRVPELNLKFGIACTPTMPEVLGIAPLESEKQSRFSIPAAEKIVFDPTQRDPALAQFQASGSTALELLELPLGVDAEVTSSSQSPWSLIKLHNDHGHSELRCEIAIHGAFSLVQRGRANVLSIKVDLDLRSSLSGVASAASLPDGTQIPPTFWS